MNHNKDSKETKEMGMRQSKQSGKPSGKPSRQPSAQKSSKKSIYDGMDDANKKAFNVLVNKGPKAAIEHMFTGDNGKELTY